MMECRAADFYTLVLLCSFRLILLVVIWILAYLPVHLISPTLTYPDTLTKHFSRCISGKDPCCLSRTSGNNLQAVQVPHTPAHQFSNCWRRARSPTSRLSSPRYHSFVCDHWLSLVLDFALDLLAWIMDSSDKDVPSTLPSSPSTPSTFAATDVSAHHTCPLCAKWMSSFIYIKRSLYVSCRDVQCSVDVSYSECQSWSTDFMIRYVN